MVFAALFRHETREKGRAEGREEGREEGIATANAAWRAWNRRRLDAEAKGEPFDEPPPDYTANSANNPPEPAAQT